MKTQPLGKSSLLSSRIAYGCWRVAGADHPRDVTAEKLALGRRAIAAAFDAGYTLFDNADIYCRGVCETILGQAMRDNPALRRQIAIATKCGIFFAGDPTPQSPQRYDFSAAHILFSVEQSLRRLGIETIDLFQLHRPDLLMDAQEVAGAFDQLRKQGKVREFGVSNFSPSQLDTLARYCPMPLVVNQVEIHLGRLHCFTDGTLDQCQRENISPMAWSPLGGGWLAAGQVGANDPDPAGRMRVIDLLTEMAHDHLSTRSNIALAWLLKHPSRIIPIVGSTNEENIRSATGAEDIELSREEWYRLLVAARGEPMP